MTIRAGVVALGLLLSACQSSDRGHLPGRAGIEPGVTTREEVYRTLGPPLSVHASPGGTMLGYSRVRSQGMKVGLRAYFMQLALGSARTTTESLFVLLSHDDVVISIRRHPREEASPGWPLWPFGE